MATSTTIDHFLIDKGVVQGITPIGIATVLLLNLNDADRIWESLNAHGC